MEWWTNLDGLGQFFFGAASALSLLFLWQLVMAMLGLGGHVDVAGHTDAFDQGAADQGALAHGAADHVTAGHTAADGAQDGGPTFHLLSVRSVLAFLTLFFWAAALYYGHHPLIVTMLLAIVWGLAAMVVVAWLFYKLMTWSEIGTQRIITAVGEPGIVYINIPTGGVGEIRVIVSGVMSSMKARTLDGKAIPAGRKVLVTKVLDEATLEVIPDDPLDELPDKPASS